MPIASSAGSVRYPYKVGILGIVAANSLKSQSGTLFSHV